MIISHRKRFAFFANPKTGSKAAGITLRMSGAFDGDDYLVRQPFAATRTVQIALPEHNLAGVSEHTTPEEAIEKGYITLDQMREYNCFAFLRCPEERYNASRIAMVMNRHGYVSNGQPIEKPHLPQFRYFYVGDEKVITSLNFGDYANELKRMLSVLDAPNRIEPPRITNKRHFENTKYVYDPRQHTQDIQLYRDMIISYEVFDS